MKVETRNLCLGYNSENLVLRDVNLSLEGNKLVSIIGPNGVGKSTLIHCLDKILSPTSGEVLINNRLITDYSLKELAKVVSYVPCMSTDTFPMTVTDTVLMGRNPHSRWGSLDEDLTKVHKALKIMDIEDLAYRAFNELSAGQHQRVMLARGLVQETDILLLDEPTANLDIKHQLAVTRMLRDYSHDNGVLVLMISHDLNIAAKYSDQIVVMCNGTIYKSGKPIDVLDFQTIFHVYGIESEIIYRNGRPHIILEDGGDSKKGRIVA